MKGVWIIDRGGKRKRAVCWGCGKVHGEAGCPKTKWGRAYPRFPQPVTLRTLRLRKELERELAI